MQTNVFVLTFNTLWIGSGADHRLCAYIQPFLDWKWCRPTSLCLHSTIFGLKAVQTNIFVLTFNTLWIGSGAGQRLYSYVQHSLDWKRRRPTSLFLHSTLFALEAVQTNVSVSTFNTPWIGSGTDQRLCDSINHSLDWKRCRPTSLCLHPTLSELEAVQANVFVLSFNTLWIGSGAYQPLCVFSNTLWIGSGTDQRLCAYSQHFL